MASFQLVKGGKWWERRARPMLDGWPQYRYLDSGAFTLLRKSSLARIKGASQPGRQGDVFKKSDTLDYAIYKEHLEKYLAFLKAHIKEFDFVFEMDMDLLTLESNGVRVPGIEITDAGRRLLRRVAGDQLIPVWHHAISDPGYARLRAMCAEYGYIAIGSDIAPGHRDLRYVIDIAHAAGTLVHGLGTSKVDVLNTTPFDTVDSTTWLSSVKFGQFAGWMYPRSTKVSTRTQSKALGAFEKIVRDLGYDPKRLLEPGGAHGTEKYEVAIALLQKRQREAVEIPEPISVGSLFDEG